MADDGAPGMAAAHLHVRHGEAGGAGDQDDLRRRRRVELGEEVDLHLQVLGRALLHDLGLVRQRRERVCHSDAVAAGSGFEAEPLHRRPHLVEGAGELGGRIGRRVPGDHVHPLAQEMGGPPGADHPGADDTHALDA